jgi:DNA-binding MarR family transcriptional regulator
MAILAATDGIEFVALKTMLEVTDGNLATHVAALERAGYLRVRKRFAGKKPVTRYTITETGRKALAKHVDALEVLLRHADWSDGR